MTSFIDAGGSCRSTSVIPAVPAAGSVTRIAFIGHFLSVCSVRSRCGRRVRAEIADQPDPSGGGFDSKRLRPGVRMRGDVRGSRGADMTLELRPWAAENFEQFRLCVDVKPRVDAGEMVAYGALAYEELP